MCLFRQRFPKRFVRYGRDDINRSFRYRMNKRYATGVQADSPVGIGATGAIFEVSPDGATDGRKLAADLMMQARLQVDFEEVIIFGLREEAVM